MSGNAKDTIRRYRLEIRSETSSKVDLNRAVMNLRTKRDIVVLIRRYVAKLKGLIKDSDHLGDTQAFQAELERLNDDVLSDKEAIILDLNKMHETWPNWVDPDPHWDAGN